MNTEADTQNSSALFFVSGWGLGHATRVHALIDEIVSLRPSVSVTVFTWGRAISYFNEASPYTVISLKSYLSPEDSLYEMSLLKRIAMAFRWLAIWIQNFKTIYSFRRSHLRGQPAIAVFDSDFHFLALVAAGVYQVALSQTAFVLENWKLVLRGEGKAKWLFRLFVWEVLEYIVCRIAFRSIICPRLDGRTFQRGKIYHTGPFARRNFRERFPALTTKVPIGWLGSGSAASASIKRIVSKLKIPPASTLSNTDVHFALDPWGRPAIDYFDRIVSQCGYSTISELILRQKPSFLVPAPGSPEQKINALFCNRHYDFFAVAESQEKEEPQLLQWCKSAMPSTTRQPLNDDGGEKTAAILLCKMFDKRD